MVKVGWSEIPPYILLEGGQGSPMKRISPVLPVGAKYRQICSRKGARRPPFDLISPVLLHIRPDTSMRDVMEHLAPLSDQF